MNQRTPWEAVNKIMLAGILPFAAVAVLDGIVLINTVFFNPSIVGGGDALMMVFLPILGYLLSCVLLIPCMAYLGYRIFKRKIGLTPVQKRLLWVSLGVVAAPPFVIILLHLLR